MVLVEKWPFFQIVFFRKYRPGKCLLRCSRRTKRLCRLKKQEVEKVEKSTFFPSFKAKNGHFSKFYFLGNIGQENVFYHILEGKKVCLGYKNKKCKKLKNWHFSKRVNPWFWSKNGHFSNFYVFGNIGQENIFYDILERKKVFLGYKNKKCKKLKNWHFSKGVKALFWSKNGHFSNFFF